MAKVIRAADGTVCVTEMKCGDVAEIVDHCDAKYIGRVVQRYDHNLITVGGDAGKGWEGLFRATAVMASFKVRILPKGTVIEL